jgi:hypothetical protein
LLGRQHDGREGEMKSRKISKMKKHRKMNTLNQKMVMKNLKYRSGKIK